MSSNGSGDQPTRKFARKECVDKLSKHCWLKAFLEKHRCLKLSELKSVLKHERQVIMSVHELSKLSRHIGISRRGKDDQPVKEKLVKIIQAELILSSEYAGYRSMYTNLKIKHKLNVRRKSVACIMRELDPHGVDARSKRTIKRREYNVKGPNALWHCDGFDKLKQYGFAIHGCVDGFSRKIMWLRVGPSNNNPNVVARYFIDCIRQLRGVPQVIRTDCGTENGIIQKLQMTLRSKHDDARKDSCFLYGTSTANQRIERLWKSLREMSLQFFMNVFAGMERMGFLCTADSLHIECMRLFFMPIVRNRLDQFQRQWNSHRIRKSRGLYSGIPCVLYAQDGNNRLMAVSLDDIDKVQQYMQELDDVDSTIVTLADHVLKDCGWSEEHGGDEAAVIDNAVRKFKFLVNAIKNVEDSSNLATI